MQNVKLELKGIKLSNEPSPVGEGGTREVGFRYILNVARVTDEKL